jgi:predicted nucleic acid-binding Zn ribbon protein
MAQSHCWKKNENQFKKSRFAVLLLWSRTQSPAPSAVSLPFHFSPAMPTYIYETTNPKKPVRRFEVRQSMKYAPLTEDPETGEPVRRVISGGLGYMSKFNAPKHADMRKEMGGGGGSCGSGCGCH